MVLGPLLLGTLLLGAPPEVAEGRRLFFDPGLGKNGVSCADCHATVRQESEEGDGLIRAGHSLAGVARRRFWRGDEKHTSYATLAEALDVCVQIFQGGAPLGASPRVALDAFLKSLSPGTAPEPALTLEPALEANLDYDRPQYRGGNPEKGRALFYVTCHGCHPHGREGIGRAIAGRAVSEVARKVREGSGLLRGNRRGSEWMPFFGRDRLSDLQVADIAAFVTSLPKGSPRP